MILDILRNGFSINTIMNLMARVFVVFCTLPVHEYAHALVATKLGDDTPRLKGRLTLAPLAHIDLVGALMIFFVGFGYAKPVPVNPRRFNRKVNMRVGMALTALAGPVANIIMAIIFMLLSNGASLAVSATGSLLGQIIMWFFYFAAQINVSLAVFNLLPIPPLDGSRIVSVFIPSKYYYQIIKYERYIIIGIFVLIFIGVLDVPLAFLSGKLMSLISFITELPFKLFI